MKIKEAIDWIDIARMGYICDPNECGLEKDGDTCKVFHCDEIHDALVMAMDALEYKYKTENLIEKLIEKLGIAECRSCKFGGTYCADCKFIDAHAILDALDDICTDNKSHHLVSQNDTKR